ncbi:hypothetical protein E2562_008527 [Oryza meyeriana var. granulata]|uniref:Uncharacterized protein n=1 Tax=Oryza meyeriana var. granulata TaxID=110450 RepID=A0A6G1C4V4_9ORYZ|nr:hypothetical protein E2562_008527 [Oryza meyeriana var. granulata]
MAADGERQRSGTGSMPREWEMSPFVQGLQNKRGFGRELTAGEELLRRWRRGEGEAGVIETAASRGEVALGIWW